MPASEVSRPGHLTPAPPFLLLLAGGCMGRPRSLNPRFPWPSPQGPASHVTLSASSEGQVKGTPGYYSRTQGISPCRPITATIPHPNGKKRKKIALGVWVSWLAGWLAGWQAGLVSWQSRQARWLAGWPGWLARAISIYSSSYLYL